MNHAAKSFFQNWIQIYKIKLELWLIFKGHRDLLQLEEKGSGIFPGCINISKSSKLFVHFHGHVEGNCLSTTSFCPWWLMVGFDVCVRIFSNRIDFLLRIHVGDWLLSVMVTDEVLCCVMRCGYHRMSLRIFRSVNPVGGGTRWLLASAAPRSPRLSFECFIKFCQGPCCVMSKRLQLLRWIIEWI